MSDKKKIASVGKVSSGVEVNGVVMEYGSAILMALDILKIAQSEVRIQDVTFSNDYKSSSGSMK
ncbi:hypothetical protein JIN77_02195 [Verrucomicrobiaceae bacterium R5-34]|nr:hypothetical protein [Verrucomicrobiaceae bacterium R5-34]